MRGKLTIVLVLAVAACVSNSVRAQVILAPQRKSGSNEQSRPVFYTDREMTVLLTDAKKYLAEDPPDYDRALIRLQRLLDSDQDAFYHGNEGKRTSSLSLKNEAQRVIANLDREGREQYERDYGIKARLALEEALRENDVAGIEEVARRFFHTQAGYRAMYRLGAYHLDHSRPLAAGLCFQLLRRYPAAAKWEPALSLKAAVCWGRAGMPEKSVEILVDLKKEAQADSITLGGERVDWFDDEGDALQWLVSVLGKQPRFRSLGQEQWTMFRGSADRNASSHEATPVWDDEWRFSLIRERECGVEDPRQLDIIANEVRKLARARIKDGSSAIPAAHPLIVDELVITRSLGRIKAVDLTTGELLWHTIESGPTYDGLVQDGSIPAPRSRYANRNRNDQPSQRERFLTQRLWDDLCSGTLSSDGHYVFSVEFTDKRLDFHQGTPYKRRNATSGPAHNKLMAFEIRDAENVPTGKLEWEVGGPAGTNGLELAGTFFLGPPLPLGGRLYCLGEVSGEIRLQVLDPDEQGRLDWSQALPVNLDMPVSDHPARRLAGLSPSYADGILICPTSSGAVVAYDLSRRVLLWGYSYPSNYPDNPRDPRALMMIRMGMLTGTSTSPVNGHWADSAVTVGDGYVLLTPRDSDEIHCLRLLDGGAVWRQPRQNALYVAAIHNEAAVLVEKTQVRAVRLKDGKPAWKSPTPLPAPSGRGYRNGNLYHLPLVTGEIATLDLNTGRLLARTPSRNGIVHGNLAAVDGIVVSQSADQLVGFRGTRQLENQIEESLAESQEDADALALAGVMDLHRGQEARGLNRLRRALNSGADSEIKTLVVATLLEGMRLDFAAYRDAIPELEGLIDDPEQQSYFRRLNADGLRQIGRSREAFSEYLKLADPDTAKPQLKRIHGSLRVRSDRWVRARLAELYAETPPDRRSALDLEIEQQFEKAREQGAEGLQGFLAYFDGHPAAEKARLELARNLSAKIDPLRLELQLQRLAASDDPELAGFGTAQLARFAIQNGHLDMVQPLLDRLDSRFSDVVCRDGKTGAQLVEDLRGNPRLETALAEGADWPTGRVDVSVDNVRATIRQQCISVENAGDSPFEGWTFAIDTSKQALIASDHRGRKRWSASLIPDGERFSLNTAASSVYVHGHLLLLNATGKLFVFDTLTDDHKPRLLWSDELTVGGAVNARTRRIVVGGAVRRGRRQVVLSDSYGRPLGQIGPVTDDSIVFQRGGKIIAADPLTGNVLWERQNMPFGCQLIGNREQLLAIPPDSDGTGILFRSLDGEELGNRAVPEGDQQLLLDGTRALFSEIADGKRQLRFVDLLSNKVIWSRQFERTAHVSVVDNDEVAVLTHEGLLTTYSVADGKPRARLEVGRKMNVSSFQLLRTPERYILLPYAAPAAGNVRVTLNSVAATTEYAFVNGPVTAFDRRSGRRLWLKHVENQCYDLLQPSGLPLMVFGVRQYNRVVVNNRLTTRASYALLVLDRRTGRFVYNAPKAPTLQNMTVSAEKSRNEMNIRTARAIFTLKLTDKPWPEKDESSNDDRDDTQDESGSTQEGKDALESNTSKPR